MGNRARATLMQRLDGTALRNALRGLGLAMDGDRDRSPTTRPVGPRTRAVDTAMVADARTDRVREAAD